MVTHSDSLREVDMEVDLAILSNQVAALTQLVEELSNRLPSKLFTVSEAAQYLGVAQVTVRRMVAVGKLPHVKVGRSIRVDLARVPSVKGRN